MKKGRIFKWIVWGGITVNDKGVGVLLQYDLKINHMHKARGAVICETDKGLKLLKQFTGSSQKLNSINKYLIYLKENGFEYVDSFVKNVNDEIITVDKDNTPYIIKDWFEGNECNVNEVTDVYKAIENLALLHKTSENQDVILLDEIRANELLVECDKHNKELKKVRAFIRDKGQKEDFEISFLKNFPIFYQQAEMVLQELNQQKYKDSMKSIKNEIILCHGDYNYHNLLMGENCVITTNFDKMTVDLQIKDLYQFMRKILEKHNWNIGMGMAMLQHYEMIRPIPDFEKYNLYLRFCYPEKFWKIANHYYNTNKAWVPARNGEKLNKLVEQESEKNKFLLKFLQSIC